MVRAECKVFRYLAFLKEGMEAMKRKRYTEEQIAFALRQHVVNDVAMHIGQTAIDAVVTNGQTSVVDPQQM